MEFKTTLMLIILNIIREKQRTLLSAIIEHCLWVLCIIIKGQTPDKKRSYIKYVSDLFQIVNHNYGKKKVYRDFVIRPGGFNTLYEELTSNPRMTIADKMCFEINRLASFSLAYPELPVSAVKLAKEGFYYVVERHICRCAFCGVEYTSLLNTDDPTEVHRRLNPDCPFVVDRSFERNISVLTGDRGFRQAIMPSRMFGSPAIAQHGYTSAIQQSISLIAESFGSSTIAQRGYTAAIQQSISHAANLPRYPEYESIARRMQTLNNWSSSRPASYFAEAGFFHTGEGDLLRCAFCGIGLLEWDDTDDPWIAHAEHSPTCFHLNQKQGTSFAEVVQRINLRSSLKEQPQEHKTNEITTSTVSAGSVTTNSPTATTIQSTQLPNHGTQHHQDVTSSNRTTFFHGTPKYPSYTTLDERFRSYSEWPTNTGQSPKVMAAAGLFFSGYQDCARCFACGGGLRNWEPDDDPWEEHARWFPGCWFVRQKRGYTFVNKIQRKHAELAKMENGSSPEPQLLNTLVNHDAVQSLLHLGYCLERIKKGLESLKHTDRQDITASLIVAHILTHEESQQADLQTSTPAATVSNEGNNCRGRDTFVCKVCKEKTPSICFFPCQHVSCCEHCAYAVRCCPVCRIEVESRLRLTLNP